MKYKGLALDFRVPAYPIIYIINPKTSDKTMLPSVFYDSPGKFSKALDLFLELYNKK